MAIYRDKKDLIAHTIETTDVVLDIGFIGHGVTEGRDNWVHKILQNRAKEIYGLDVEIDRSVYKEPHYKQASAEDFQFDTRFDVIFASDLIEHLSNPGLFLQSCKKNLKSGGKLVATTGNAFCLFNMAEKITKYEPTTNKDHTCYFNSRTLRQLFAKNGLTITDIDYVYWLNIGYQESLKKKFLNGVYWLLSKCTDKYIETIVVTAVVTQ